MNYIEVYNTLGEKVYSESSVPNQPSRQANSVDITSLANGNYFYKVVTSDGELKGSGKLMIGK